MVISYKGTNPSYNQAKLVEHRLKGVNEHPKVDVQPSQRWIWRALPNKKCHARRGTKHLTVPSSRLSHGAGRLAKKAGDPLGRTTLDGRLLRVGKHTWLWVKTYGSILGFSHVHHVGPLLAMSLSR